jgi:hypothetical protein
MGGAPSADPLHPSYRSRTAVVPQSSRWPVVAVVPTSLFALPPALAEHIERGLRQGAAPVPLVDLNTQMLSLGPYRMSGGAFDLLVYTGPVMTYNAVANLGTKLNVVA